MYNLESIFLFFFIFSVLTVVRTVFRFISPLLQDSPKKVELSNKGLIYLGVAISYILTFILKS
jgi:hypothetical protein